MKTKTIEAIQNCIDAKREMNDGISNYDIKSIMNWFVYDMDKEIAWEVKQHFSRKYKI